jgi:hypothetical protein
MEGADFWEKVGINPCVNGQKQTSIRKVTFNMFKEDSVDHRSSQTHMYQDVGLYTCFLWERLPDCIVMFEIDRPNPMHISLQCICAVYQNEQTLQECKQ